MNLKWNQEQFKFKRILGRFMQMLTWLTLSKHRINKSISHVFFYSKFQRQFLWSCLMYLVMYVHSKNVNIQRIHTMKLVSRSGQETERYFLFCSFWDNVWWIKIKIHLSEFTTNIKRQNKTKTNATDDMTILTVFVTPKENSSNANFNFLFSIFVCFIFFNLLSSRYLLSKVQRAV